MWRGAQQVFLTFADENVIPAAERIVEAFDEDGLAGAMEQVKVEWEKAWPEIKGWLEDTVAPALVDFGTVVGKAMAAALWDGFINALTGDQAPKPDSYWDAVIDPWRQQFRDWDWIPEPSTLPGPGGRPDSSGGGTSSGGGGMSQPGRIRPMHDGGIVPGRAGQEVPILAMAGETVIPTHKSGGGGINITNLNVGSIGDADEMGRELRKLAIAGAYGG
jgi:hypothetical protein